MTDTKKIEDGGPAYPSAWTQLGDDMARIPGEGMSLRDAVAIRAFVLLLQNQNTTFEDDAKNAFKAADAFLAARKSGGEA